MPHVKLSCFDISDDCISFERIGQDQQGSEEECFMLLLGRINKFYTLVIVYYFFISCPQGVTANQNDQSQLPLEQGPTFSERVKDKSWNRE